MMQAAGCADKRTHGGPLRTARAVPLLEWGALASACPGCFAAVQLNTGFTRRRWSGEARFSRNVPVPTRQ